jgi:mono/diheme cytochrome c family protein
MQQPSPHFPDASRRVPLSRASGRGARRLHLVLIFSLVAGWPAAAGAADQSAIDPVEQGRTLYALHCSHCHGFNMVNPGTVAFDLRRFPQDDKARFVNSVTQGKNNRMPPWGDVLSPEQIDELWAYIRTGGKS